MKVALAALVAAGAFLIGALRMGDLTTVPLPTPATVGVNSGTVPPSTPANTLSGNAVGAHAKAGPNSAGAHAKPTPGSDRAHAGPSPNSEPAATKSAGTSWPPPSQPPSIHFTTGSLPPVDRVRHGVKEYDTGDKGDRGDKGHGGGR